MKQDKRKFLADQNLGRLAKWLRLLGYDTLFYKNLSLYTLSRIANSENRIYLTRSIKSSRSKLFDGTILIKSDSVFEQLKELKDYLAHNQHLCFNRCSLCNSLLHYIAKEKVEKMVPEYTYETEQEFKVCFRCGKIYWKGSHIEKMESILTMFNHK